MWWFSICKLVWRTRGYWTRFVPFALAALTATVILGVASAASLSREQQVESTLGQADGQAEVGTQVAAGTVPAPIRTADLPQGTVLTDQLISTIAVVAPRQVNDLLYVETELPGPASRGVLELISGRWPTRAGEVLATPALELPNGTTIATRVGSLHLTVVGNASRRYSTGLAAIVAAPGTWKSWKLQDGEATMAGLVASRTVLFTSPDPDGVCRALLGGNSLGAGSLGCDTRDSLLVRSGSSPQLFLVERGLPALLLEGAGALLTAGLLSRFLRRSFRPLADLGFSRRGLRLLAAWLLATGAGLATAIGVTAGVGLTAAARPIMAARIDHPLGPAQWPTEALLGSVVGILLMIAFARPLPAYRAVANRHAFGEKTVGRCAGLGSLALAIAIAAALLGSPRLSIIALIVIGSSVGLALWAPLIITNIGLRLRPRPGRGLAAIRGLHANSRGYGGYAVTVAALIGMVCASLALAGGVAANLNLNSGTGIPAGMVVLNTRVEGLTQLPDAVVTEFQDTMGLSDPVTLWQGATPGAAGDQVTPWWAFSSVADTRRAFPELTDHQADLLERSGTLSVAQQDTRQVDELSVPWDARWLKQIKLSTHPPEGTTSTSLLYVALSPEQDRQAASWAEAHGIDPVYVQATSVAPDVPIPELTFASAIIFAVVTALMGMVAMRGEVTAMKGLLAAFRSLGLGRSWCSHVLVLISLIVSTTATVLGWLAGIVSALLIKGLLGGALLVNGIPWGIFALIGLATLLGGLAGGAMSSYRFSSQEINGR